MIYEWLADDKAPAAIAPANIEGFRNRDGRINTIRVDSKVAHETDTGEAKSAENAWMRFQLDTVGRQSWPLDRQGRPVYPDGFEELAKKLDRPLHPPGRDVCCIVSVGMLTEGWDCNTVTHIVGLRPFMSQLLCEQVVGRGLRRAHQVLRENNLYDEEVAKVFGVPFTIIPFKAQKQAAPPEPVKRHHVHAIPTKTAFEIRFPRVEGYTQAIRNRIAVDWSAVPSIVLDPLLIPPEVEVKGMNVNNQGRLSLAGPGRVDQVTLQAFRDKHRVQELTFDLARALTRDCLEYRRCDVPAHVLFPQLAGIVQRYLAEKVTVHRPSDLKDVFLSPYYGWVIECLREAIRPDTSQGEAPEVPRYDSRGDGTTADVDFWTSREVREVTHCHLNYVTADTLRWEQSAAYFIDKHPAVAAFVKNAGLGFAIPYIWDGQPHDYIPDFLIRLKVEPMAHLILETKGPADSLADVKRAAAERWVDAVNADGMHGHWQYALAKKPSEATGLIDAAMRAAPGRQE
jgi:type III restriction enzyme